MGNKKDYIAATCPSPSQIAGKFDVFVENFEELLYQIQLFRSYFIVILGDFNARSKTWCNADITSNEGSQIDSLTTTYGLQQCISYPTHILSNSYT